MLILRHKYFFIIELDLKSILIYKNLLKFIIKKIIILLKNAELIKEIF